jgi:NADPH-dependent curcumin reductase CurA
MTKINRQLRLARRPRGLLDDATIEYAATEPPEPVDGQALVQVELLSIDPTIRTWMDDVQGYLPPIALGEGNSKRRHRGGRRTADASQSHGARPKGETATSG